MAKDSKEIERLQKSFLRGSLLVIAANVPVSMLIVWALGYSGDALKGEVMRWPIIVACLCIIAFELWLGYRFMVKPANELASLPDVDAPERKT